jgi:hypothetical protein
MEHMRDVWAREWLLRSIAMRHDTHTIEGNSFQDEKVVKVIL